MLGGSHNGQASRTCCHARAICRTSQAGAEGGGRGAGALGTSSKATPVAQPANVSPHAPVAEINLSVGAAIMHSLSAAQCFISFPPPSARAAATYTTWDAYQSLPPLPLSLLLLQPFFRRSCMYTRTTCQQLRAAELQASARP